MEIFLPPGDPRHQVPAGAARGVAEDQQHRASLCQQGLERLLLPGLIGQGEGRGPRTGPQRRGLSRPQDQPCAGRERGEGGQDRQEAAICRDEPGDGRRQRVPGDGRPADLSGPQPPETLTGRTATMVRTPV
jgi:hypothetical protein